MLYIYSNVQSWFIYPRAVHNSIWSHVHWQPFIWASRGGQKEFWGLWAVRPKIAKLRLVGSLWDVAKRQPSFSLRPYIQGAACIVVIGRQTRHFLASWLFKRPHLFASRGSVTTVRTVLQEFYLPGQFCWYDSLIWCAVTVSWGTSIDHYL